MQFPLFKNGKNRQGNGVFQDYYIHIEQRRWHKPESVRMGKGIRNAGEQILELPKQAEKHDSTNVCKATLVKNTLKGLVKSMASLYEIDRSILECVDMDTGELIDPERLEGLYMERSQKIENIVLWIKNLQSDALAFKAEKEAFDKREKAATAKAESLKRYLAQALQGEKFSTDKCAVSFRRSEQVEILDENALPEEFKVKAIVFRPNKTAIKAALKEGQDVIGCRLTENMNPQIR